MAPLETPPGEDQTARPQEAESATTRVRRRGRFVDLEQHELITLLDEVDDERSRARFRESIYISVIVWLVLGWVMVYGPRYLWHSPVIINSPDLKTNTTFLDTPPDLQKLLKRIKPPNTISQRDAEAQSPKPSPQAPKQAAGTPQPPAPTPTPAPQPQQAPQAQQAAPQPAQQQARNTPPTPTPPTPQPRPSQPLADAPSPSTQPNKSIFGGQKSAADAIRDAAKGARSGEGGDYGSGASQQGGAKQGVQILSDQQGVDFSKYLARLLSDVRRGWLPLIPEECRPPLNKQGITGVRFTILPDGKIAPGSMHLDYSTHDDAINRAAWGSITGLGQAQPLPKEFHGPNLELRIEFRINKDAPEAQ